MKKILPFLIFFIQIIPNYGFYLSLMASFGDKIFSLPLLIQIVIYMFIIASSIFITRISLSKLNEELEKTNLENALETVTVKGDFVKLVRDNLPREKGLKTIYSHGKKLVKAWSSDGILLEVNFYLKIKNDVIEKSIQIFGYSAIRNEKIAYYLPRSSRYIEEGDFSNFELFANPPIHTFLNWREFVIKASEMNTAHFEKADFTNIQITSTKEELDCNITFSKSNREWRKRYSLKGNNIYNEKKEVIYNLI